MDMGYCAKSSISIKGENASSILGCFIEKDETIKNMPIMPSVPAAKNKNKDKIVIILKFRV